MHPEETERWTNAFLQCACDPSIPGVNFKTGPKLKKRLRLIPGLPDDRMALPPHVFGFASKKKKIKSQIE